jgi:transglutaminase-like putative cysteine protease
VHAVAHDRYPIAVPLLVLVFASAMLGSRVRYRPGLLFVAGAIGTLAGLGLGLASPPPDGPIPPAVLSPLCGFLIGLTVYCTVARNALYAWTYSFLLVVVSLNGPPGPVLHASQAALALSVLLSAMATGGTFRGGLSALPGVLVFAVALAGATLGLARLVFASEGMLVSAVYELLKDGAGSGAGFQQVITMRTVSRVNAGMRTILDLSGPAPRRLRTLVLDRFDGASWVTSRELSEARPPLVLEAADVEPRSLEMTVLEKLGNQLPAPAGTRAVWGTTAEVCGGLVLRGAELRGRTVTFRYDPRERLPEEPQPADPRLTDLPQPLGEALRPIAEEITRGSTTARGKAEAIAAHLRQGFRYSLSTDLRGPGHPLVVLLRERRPAYCIYFASAMAALLRSLDVPARLVGGFIPAERSSVTGRTLVRERDAHAWVEVYLPEERRFVPFDPTPFESREEVLELRDRPGFTWAILQAVSQAAQRFLARVRTDPAEVLAGLLLSKGLWSVLVAIGAWSVWRRLRGRSMRFSRGRAVAKDPVLWGSYAAYLKALKRGAALVPHAAETDDELLVRLRAARGEGVAAAAARFVELYRTARYRRDAVGGEALAATLAELDGLLRAPRDASRQ